MEKDVVIARHFDFFQDFGFEYHNSHGLFYKDFPQGKQAIFIHYAKYEEEAFLEYNIGVRIDQVELMVHQFLPSLQGYEDRSLTLIQPLNKIDQNLPRRFILDAANPLLKAQKEIENFFIKKGFKWLDDLVQVKRLQEEFETKKAKGFVNQNYAFHVFRATALSKLVAPEKYHELRSFFLSQLENQGITPITIASYLQFLNFLDSKY